MSTNFEKVQEFHRATGIESPEYPTDPDWRTQVLRQDLLQEEVDELRDAFLDGDVVAIADAVADILYVTYGTADVCGIDADAVFAEVHRSNMTKVQPDGSVLRRADGKILKPKTYSPPDIMGVLREAEYKEWSHV